MGRQHLASLAAIILAGLWGAALALPHLRGGVPILERIEAPLVDLRFLILGPRPAPVAVTIIAIDDRTAQEAGSFPLPRASLARLLSILAAGKPKAFALDLLLVDAGPAEGDRALAAALRETPSVLAAAAVFDDKSQAALSSSGSTLDDIPKAQRLLLPLKIFGDVAGVGVVNIATDPSGVPRHVPLLLRSGDQLVPSFPLRAASAAMKRDPVIGDDAITIGEATTRTDTGFTLPLRFYGPGGTIRTISASDVLKSRLTAPLDEGALRDRIVVVGSTVTGGGDVFPTPFDQVMPGVEVLATAIANIVKGGGLVRDRRVRLVDAATAIALPMILVLLLAWHRSLWGFAFIGMVLILTIGIALAAFSHGIWLSVALPLAATVPPAVLFGALTLWRDRRRADHLALESVTLKRFQPPSLTARLARDPGFLLEPVQQDAAMLFIDLSGFTGLSEVMDLDETQEMLRTFHALVDEVAIRHHGLVASFMGDGAMLLFGLPESGPEDAAHAAAACVDLCARMNPWLTSLPAPMATYLGFKIGAHYGPILASRLGGDSHQHITAVGDAVNVASRLMEVAAAHRAEIALSDDLLQAAGSVRSVLDSGFLEGPLAATIRGRAGSIRIWLWRDRPEAMVDAG